MRLIWAPITIAANPNHVAAKLVGLSWHCMAVCSLCPLACGACLAALQAGVLLLVHGEVTDAEVDFFDREKVFIEAKLKPLLDKVRARLLGMVCLESRLLRLRATVACTQQREPQLSSSSSSICSGI